MKLTLDLTGGGRATVTRRFNATPAQVYRAHVEPDLIRQWMGGLDGWEITECVSDPRPGGKILQRFEGPEGATFAIDGEFISLDPDREINHVERMLMPDPTPDNRIQTLFQAVDGGTLLTLHMELPDEASLKAMLDTGMAEGMEQSYARIDALFT